MAIIRNLIGTGLSGLAAQAITGTVGDGLVATGTTQADALLISNDMAVFATVASGAGAIFTQGGENDQYCVVNGGANALSIYPPVGGTINALSVNAAYSLPSGGRAIFRFQTNLLILEISSTGSGSVVVAAGKTLTVDNSLELAGTDGTKMTFPTTSASIARTDAGNAFVGANTFDTSILDIGTGQLYKDASGNVGVGTNSPTSYGKFAVVSGSIAKAAQLVSTDATAYSAGSAISTYRLRLAGGNATNAQNGIQFSGSGGTCEGYFGLVQNAGGTGEFVWQGYSGSAYVERMRLDATSALTFNARINLKSYTVATLPSATTGGGVVYVSDAAVAPCMAFTNGTNWKRCDNAATTVV